MNKQKLIGTILGVIMFIALIAGATFAWFTLTINVTNGNYNVSTKTFLIDYTKGTNISSVPILLTATSATASNLEVSAQRTESNPNGTMNIKLTTTSSGTLVTSGALNYAVCVNTTQGAGCANLSSAVATGIINSTGEVTLYTVNSIPTTKTYYTIYFWLSMATITNEHIGQEYQGYIHASATQSE